MIAYHLALLVATIANPSMRSAVPSLRSSQPPVAPFAYFAPGIAFDSARGRLVVFGGEGNDRAYSGDTWEFDGTRWMRTATTGPSPRIWSAMAYDARRGRIVLFGGSGSGYGALGDTWEYDGQAWTRIDAQGPAPRYAHELAYDDVRGRVLLFGGRAANALADTWEWDGREWKSVPVAGPGARFTHALAFDGVRNALLLFGGYGRAMPGAAVAEASLGDFWQLDPTRWRASDDLRPVPRDHVSMAFDRSRGRLVLFGGGGGGGPTPRTEYSDTWEWDARAWRRLSTKGPPVVGNHRLVYDAARQRVVLWTGVPDAPGQSGIWEWDGTGWTRRWPTEHH